MTVYRVDLFVADPDELRRWIADNVPAAGVVRTQVFPKQYGSGVFVAVFNRKEYADAFERHWAAKAADDLANLPDKWKAWAAHQEAAPRPEESTEST